MENFLNTELRTINREEYGTFSFDPEDIEPAEDPSYKKNIRFFWQLHKKETLWCLSSSCCLATTAASIALLGTICIPISIAIEDVSLKERAVFCFTASTTFTVCALGCLAIATTIVVHPCWKRFLSPS